MDAPAELPTYLDFPPLHLSPAAELPRGVDTYATTFEQARDLFNAGVPRARKALDFYKLDGWVTAHLEILFDISKAYGCDTRYMQRKLNAVSFRCRGSHHMLLAAGVAACAPSTMSAMCRALALFETDAHRASVMHRQRIKTFSAVEGDNLSYQHFEGLVKSVALEVANAARQIWTIKDGNEWPAPKVAAANREAAERVSAFVRLFRSEKGDLPDKVESVWEQHVMTACITCARLALQCKVRARIGRCSDRHLTGARCGSRGSIQPWLQVPPARKCTCPSRVRSAGRQIPMTT